MEVTSTRPIKMVLRKTILDSVCRDHYIKLSDLLGGKKEHELVDARIDAAQRLLANGFTKSHIGRILHRDHTTIKYYFSADMGAEKRQRLMHTYAVRRLPKDVREIVLQVAAAQNTKPENIVTEWVSERAHYEAEAKARAA